MCQFSLAETILKGEEEAHQGTHFPQVRNTPKKLSQFFFESFRLESEKRQHAMNFTVNLLDVCKLESQKRKGQKYPEKRKSRRHRTPQRVQQSYCTNLLEIIKKGKRSTSSEDSEKPSVQSSSNDLVLNIQPSQTNTKESDEKPQQPQMKVEELISLSKYRSDITLLTIDEAPMTPFTPFGTSFTKQLDKFNESPTRNNTNQSFNTMLNDSPTRTGRLQGPSSTAHFANLSYINEELSFRGLFEKLYQISEESFVVLWQGQKVVAKLIKEQNLRVRLLSDIKDTSLNQEINMLKSISHENLASVIDVCRHQDNIIILYEYINGSQLKHSFGEIIARRYFKQLLNGLNYIHNGLHTQHGSISPSKILVDQNDSLKITNMGVLNLIESEPTNDIQQAGKILLHMVDSSAKEITQSFSPSLQNILKLMLLDYKNVNISHLLFHPWIQQDDEQNQDQRKRQTL